MLCDLFFCKKKMVKLKRKDNVINCWFENVFNKFLLWIVEWMLLLLVVLNEKVFISMLKNFKNI